MDAMAASSRRLGSSRNCMLVKPSAFTKSRLASEYWQSTPSLGFQLGARWRWACKAAARRRTAPVKAKLPGKGLVNPALNPACTGGTEIKVLRTEQRE